MSELRQELMRNQSAAIHLLACLKKLREDGPTTLQEGICENIRHVGAPNIYPMPSLWVHWPKFSGHVAYPVPAPSDKDQRVWLPGSYYMAVNAGGGDMWAGEYGELRKELLNWLIDTIEEHLEP